MEDSLYKNNDIFQRQHKEIFLMCPLLIQALLKWTRLEITSFNVV